MWSYHCQCHQDSFLPLAPDGGKWSAARRSRFTDRKERRYQFNNETGWLLSRSGRFGEVNKFLVSTGIRTPDLLVRTIVTIPTTISRPPQHLQISWKISKKSEHFSQTNENQIKLGGGGGLAKKHLKRPFGLPKKSFEKQKEGRGGWGGGGPLATNHLKTAFWLPQ